MGRGDSCGGGQSSLGYLFGAGAEAADANESPSPNRNNASSSSPAKSILVNEQLPAGKPTRRDVTEKHFPPASNTTPSPNKTSTAPHDDSKPVDKNIAASLHSSPSPTNNYIRTDGQNCGNFVTDRPSTKVHSVPGGGSSLGYLFGGGGGK